MDFFLRRTGWSAPDSPSRSLRSERSLNSTLSNHPTTNSSKHTATTSSITTASKSDHNLTKHEPFHGQDADDESLRLPYLLPTSQPSTRMMGEEIKLLRRRVEEHQQKGEQQDRKIRKLEKQLAASQENADRWKHALEGDVRPGSHYRLDIASLKEELDARDEIIQEREEVIENLMSRNKHHAPSSYYRRSIPTSLETSVCSSLVDDAPDYPPHEVERLLSENEVYAEKLLAQEEELRKLRKERSTDEQERASQRNTVASFTLKTSSDRNEAKKKARGRPIFRTERRTAQHKEPVIGHEEINLEEASLDSSSEPFDAVSLLRHPRAPNSPTGSATSSHRESSRTMKRLMELQNELSKVTKERSSCQQELDSVRKERDSNKSLFQQLQADRDALATELKQVRNDLWKAKLHSEDFEEMVVQLQQTKFALNGSMSNVHSSRQVSKKQDNAFRDMSQTIVRLQAEIRKRDAELADLKTIKQRKSAAETDVIVQQHSMIFNDELRGAVVELQKASIAQTEQGKRIHDLRRDLRNRKEENIRLQQDLRSRQQNLVHTRSIASGKEHESDSTESSAGMKGLGSNEEFDVLRNELKLRVEEVEKLQSDLGHRTQSLVRLRKELAEKEMEIDELLDSKQQLAAAADRARSAQLEMQEQTTKDKEDLLKLSHEQNGRLLEKVKIQKDTISKMEKHLNEKEKMIEKLQSSCNEMIDAVEEDHANTRNQLEHSKETNKRLVQELDDQKGISQRAEKNLESVKKNLSDKLEKVIAEKEKLSEEKVTIQRLLQEKEKSIEVMSRDVDLSLVNSDQMQKGLAEKDRRISELEASKKSLNDNLKSSLEEQFVLVEEKKHLMNLLSQKNDANEIVAQDLEGKTAVIDQLRQHLSERECQILEVEASKTHLTDALEQSRSIIRKTEDDTRELQCLLEQHVEAINYLTSELSTEKQKVDLINERLLDKDTKISNQDKNLRELEEKLEKSAREGQEKERRLEQSRRIAEEQTKESSALQNENEMMSEELLKTKANLLDKCECLNELEKTKDDILVEVKCLRAKLRDIEEQNDSLKECINKHGDELVKARNELQAKDVTIDSLRRMRDEMDASINKLCIALDGEETTSRGIDGVRQELNAESDVNFRTKEIQRHLKEKDESIARLNRELDDEKESLVEARHKIWENDNKVEHLNEIMSRQSEEMRTLRDKLQILSEENDCMRHKLQLQIEESGNLREEISALNRSIESATRSKDEADEALNNALHELGEKDAAIKELETAYVDLSEQLNGLRRDVSAARNESSRQQETHNEEVSKVNLELTKRTAHAESAEMARKELEEALKTSNRDILARDRQLEDLKEVQSKSFEEANALREKIKELLGEIDLLKGEVDSRGSCLIKIRQEIAGKDANLESLEKMKNDSESALQDAVDHIVMQDRMITEFESELSMASAEVNRLNRELDDEKESLVEARHKILENDNKVEHLNEIMSKQSEEMRTLRDELQISSEENECMRHKLGLQIEESGNLREEISAQNRSIESATRSKDEADEALNNALHELGEKDVTIKELETAYVDLSEQLNGLRRDVSAARNESSRQQETHNEEVSKVNLELTKQTAHAESAEMARKELEEALETSNRDILARDRQLEDLKEVQSKSFEEANALREKIKELLGEIDLLKGEVDSRGSCLIKIRQEIAGKDANLESLEKMKNDSESALQDAVDHIVMQDRMITEFESELSMASSEVNRLIEENKAYDGEKELMNQTVANCRGEVTKLRQELAEKTSELESVAKTENQLKETLESLRLEVDKRDREIANLSKLRNIVSDKMSNLLIDVKSARAENDRLKSDDQYRSLELLAENDRLKNDVEMQARDLFKARQELLEKNSIIESLQGIKAEMDEALECVVTERKAREELSNKRTELSKQMEVLQAELKQKNEECKRMEMDLMSLRQSQSELTIDVSAKADEMKKTSLTMESLRVEKEDLSTKNASLSDQIKDLSYELVELKDEINELKDRSRCNDSFDSLKVELDQVKKSENDTVQSYERQICALTMNKDVTIDTLRKDLAAARTRSAEEVARLTNELSKMQEVNNELEKLCNDDAICKKDQQIHALERTLFAQEKTVDMLQNELDQLQFSMLKAAEQRRSDIEELQKELMDNQTELKKQNRDVLSLKAQLGACKELHEAESKRLRAEVDRLRKQTPLARAMEDLQQTNMMIEVKERLEQLKVTNIELKEENIKLAARLERAAIRVQTIEEEKKIVAESEEECRALRRELKELEALLEKEVQKVKDEVKRIRKAEKSEGTGASKSSSSSRGIFGLGKRPKLKKWGAAKQIPSVLYISQQHDEASGMDEEV